MARIVGNGAPVGLEGHLAAVVQCHTIPKVALCLSRRVAGRMIRVSRSPSKCISLLLGTRIVEGAKKKNGVESTLHTDTYTELLRRDVEPPSTTVVVLLEEPVLDELLPSKIQSCRSAS
jgi:hypothetical protein